MVYFLVTSRYTAPPDTIGAHLAAHRAWLDGHYARGIFLLSGLLHSGGGGFMLARGVERFELDILLATDPFRTRGLLVHDVLELAPTRWCAALTGLEQEAS